MNNYSFRFKLSALIFIMGAFFFVACKKNKEISILFSGNISDPNQNIKVNEAEIKLYSKIVEYNSFNNNYKLIASQLSDINGSYSLEFKRENVVDYKLVITKDNYFYSEQIINPDDISSENGNIYNVTLIPKGWIKLHITNSAPVNSGDQVSFSYFENTYNCPTCCSTIPITLYGTTVDTTIKCETWANKTIGHQAIVTKLNTPSIKKGTITTVFGDTVVIDFPY